MNAIELDLFLLSQTDLRTVEMLSPRWMQFLDLFIISSELRQVKVISC